MVVFTEKTIDQQKDDLLLLYTDGVTEAVNFQKLRIWAKVSGDIDSTIRANGSERGDPKN
jgi:serine phosphatase RsbU (regulator of sigma subunit)